MTDITVCMRCGSAWFGCGEVCERCDGCPDCCPCTTGDLLKAALGVDSGPGQW
jgi:hypothetical protein